MTKTQLKNAILEANPAAKLDPKATKAELEAALVLLAPDDEAEPEAEPEAEDDAPKTMAKTLQHYRVGYAATTAYSGRKSLNNGDDLAVLLAGLDADTTIRIALAVLENPSEKLQAGYPSLNPGQRRMNSGNAIRAAVKRLEVTIAQVTEAFESQR